jgi:hypothetical protein
LNADRRQLTPEQLREIAVTQWQDGHAMRSIAHAHGVDEGTIRHHIRQSGAEVSAPEYVLGRDGKHYPSRKPTVVAAKDEKEARRAQAALERIAELRRAPTDAASRLSGGVLVRDSFLVMPPLARLSG